MDEKAINALATQLRKPEVITQQFFKKPFQTACKDPAHPELPEFLSVPLLAVPDGFKMVDVKPLVDAFRDTPERRQGDNTLDTAQAFIDFVNRYKGADTVLFAKAGQAEGKISAKFDYHPAGTDQEKAGWQKFSAHYNFPTSEAFKIWAKHSGHTKSMKEFSSFLSDRIPDLGEASTENPVTFDLGILDPQYALPGAILELADGLSINAKKKYSQHQRLQSGEHQVEFAEEHEGATNKAGKTIKVPEFFLLNISVFEEGPKVLIPVRLRYSIDNNNGIDWKFDVWNVVQIFNKAFRDEVAKITSQTTLPQFFGNP